MVELTKMSHKKFVLNADHIQEIEEVPETLITLTNGKKHIVMESMEYVIREVVNYKKRIFSGNL